MHVASFDQGFVAAPPAAVYPELADLARYERWWPRWSAGLHLGGRASLAARAEGHRQDVGLILHIEGRVTGTLEWYLEPFEEGTIVYAILNLDVAAGERRTARRLLRARSELRRALVALKRRLEAR